jgi:predicted phosphodiesterase
MGGVTRVAALYDIHGNLPALEAVLRDARAAGADRVVVGGDVLPGPMPAECLDLLAAIDLPITCIVGNGEVAVLAEREGRDSGVPAARRPPIQWVAAQLTDAHARTIGAWPKTARLAAGDGEVCFCHATPRHENEIFTRLTDERKLAAIFAAAGAATVVCGHTHMQFDRGIGGARVLNAGSVGMPFGATGAHWLLLGERLELRRTEYDLRGAADRIRATAYPGAAGFAEQYILNAPSEAVMLEAYSKAELT